MWSSSRTNKFLACNLELSLDVGGRTRSVTPHKYTDVDDVKYVINVDFPNCSEDYIHRIGRTARSNNTGTAYTFFTFENMKQAKDLVDVLQEANQTVNPKLLDLVEMSRSFSFGRGRKWGGKNNNGVGKRGGHFESNRHHPYKRRDQDEKNSGYGNKGGRYGGGNYGNYENKSNSSGSSWGNKNYENRNNESSSNNWGNKSYENSRNNDYESRNSGNSWSANSGKGSSSHKIFV